MLNRGDLAMISMEKALLDELRQRLERDRDNLRAEIRQIEDQEVHAENQYDPEFSGYGNHMAETGTEIYEQERNLTLEQTLKQQLAEVEHALAKFDEGTYGICDTCRKDIALERLQALPQAALCINCKGRQETQRR
jgi:DnaK suppressor protein